MPLHLRVADPAEYPQLEAFVIESFEPITWYKKLDARFGPLNGLDWRDRWHARLAAAFASQVILVGEAEGQVVAFASGTVDVSTRLGFIDILAVDRRFQGKGYGREMLRGTLRHYKVLGAVHVHLECLADNDAGNSLYRSEGFEEVARSIRWFVKIS
jgi:ribosomal protein S18 acetylase RimI-like enzyme